MKHKKTAIKLSTFILIGLMSLVVISVFASNLVLKNVYDNRDKSDIYWNYVKISEQPYKYLKIDGGNITNIVFEPGKRSSVRALNNWWNYNNKDSALRVYVRNDTLHLYFKNTYNNLGEKYWLQGQVIVRLFSPQLLAVDGNNTNFELQKLKQPNISIDLKGKSRLEVETYDHNFDTVRVSQRDSTQVIFEMSPDIKGSPIMHFKHVYANMKDLTLFDVGRSYIDDIKLNLSDSSAVILSGRSLRRLSNNSLITK